MKIIFLVSFLLLTIVAFAQDLYIKSYPSIPNPHQTIFIESLPDNSYVVAGSSIDPNNPNHIYLRKFNPCGEEMWYKDISETNNNLNIAGLHIDSNDYIVLSAKANQYTDTTSPYIIKFDQNGIEIFSKSITSTFGYGYLIHESAIAANGDYLIMGVYRYDPSPPNYFKYAISRIDTNGNHKWTKSYDGFFPWKWGVMNSTKDNGAIVNMSGLIFKVDSVGNIDWAKNYSIYHNLAKPFETDSGYVFPRYVTAALDRGGVVCISHDGSVKWTTESYLNFYPYNGIKRRNGNILLTGGNPFDSYTIAFLELDYKTGNTIKLSKPNNQGINGIKLRALTEDNSGNFLFTGPDSRGFIPQLTVAKFNNTLSTQTCADSLINPIFEQYNGFFLRDSAITPIVKTDIISDNIELVIIDRILNPSIADCAFTKSRGILDLGPDTTLCIGQSVILGDNTTSFDAYLWSNGSTNKTIGVNQSGIYLLQVVSACDTLRDTIRISYLPDVLFSLGPDTTFCYDSIVLGSNLNPSNNYLWSTGETTTSIVIKSPGGYWVEYTDKCNSFRDSILVRSEPRPSGIDLGPDTILCPKEAILLGDPNSDYISYLWSTSETTKAITVDSAGKYWLKTKNVCREFRDTINISYYPLIGLDLGIDESICANKPIVLAPSKRFSNYEWSTGATTPSIVVSFPGTYWLKTQTNCGPVSDTIIISPIPAIMAPSLGSDTMICFNTTLDLNANTLGSFIWSTGDASNIITVGSGVYWLEYYNDCDTLRDSIVITESLSLNPSISTNSNQPKSRDTILFIHKSLSGLNPAWNFGDGYIASGDSVLHSYFVSGTYTVSLQVNNSRNCIETVDTIIKIEPQDYFIPNIFTPNNDLINDRFKPYGNDIKSYSMKIYDNWGKVIFSESNIAWNGRDKAQRKVGDGTYFYVIQLELYHGVKEEYSGPVNLVR